MLASPRKPPGRPSFEPSPESAQQAAIMAALPATPFRCSAAGSLVALTSTTVLAVPGRHNELVVMPLGAVLSPLPSLSLPSYTLDPASCSKCGAYVNVYAPASGDRGEWHCNFCLHFNVDPGGGGAAAGGVSPYLGTPVMTPSQSADLEAPADQALQIRRTQQQQAAQQPFSSYTTPPSAASLGPAVLVGGSGAAATPLTPLQPLLAQEAVDYIAPVGASVAAWAAAAGLSGPWAMPGGSSKAGGVTVLVVDLAASPGDLEAVKGALAAGACALPDGARVALVAAGATLHVYRLSSAAQQQQDPDRQPEAVQSDVLPGDLGQDDEYLLEGLRLGVHVLQVGQCRSALLAALQSLRPYQPRAGPRPRCIPGAVEVALHLCQLGQQVQHSGRAAHKHAAHAGQAQQEAAAGPLGGPQAQEMDREEGNRPPGHIVVVTTGKAAKGYSPLPSQQAAAAPGEGEEGAGEGNGEQWEAPSPGTAQLAKAMGLLANRAALASVAVDILSAGADPDHIPAISPLAQGTAGLFVQLRQCDEAFAANITSAVYRTSELTATLEIRTSSGLAVRDTYGAVVPLFAAGRPTEQWQALAGGTAPPPPRWLNRRTWHYRCSPPSDSSGVTLVLQCDKPLAQTYAYMQVVWSWIDEDGHRMQRIVTRRLRTTQNPAAEVEALSPGVAAVVWAKALVAQALERGAAFNRKETEILRRSLGKRLFEFVSRFGYPDDSSRGWFSGPSRFVLPSAFLPIAQALYCLHRGPMLHHALGYHPEERALLQAHFMTASLGLASTMCLPTLHLLTSLEATEAANGVASAADGSAPNTAAAAEPCSEYGAVASAEAEPPAHGLPRPLSQLRLSSRSTATQPAAAAAALRSHFVSAPPCDMSLYDSPAAVLDHGSHIFVWLHQGLSEEERAVAEEQCRRFALLLGGDRVPVPEVVVDNQQLLARLIPIRTDPNRAQLQQAPMLSGVSRSLLDRSAKALGPVDELSFYQWLLEHGMLPEGGDGDGPAK